MVTFQFLENVQRLEAGSVRKGEETLHAPVAADDGI
jgi:hypothetical protein